MTAWLAVLLVGAGSYAFRWLPLVLADRRPIPPAVTDVLRHASLAAVVALATGALRADALTGTPTAAVPTAAAVVAAVVAARRRRPSAVVLAAGLLTHQLAAVFVAITT